MCLCLIFNRKIISTLFIFNVDIFKRIISHISIYCQIRWNIIASTIFLSFVKTHRNSGWFKNRRKHYTEEHIFESCEMKQIWIVFAIQISRRNTFMILFRLKRIGNIFLKEFPRNFWRNFPWRNFQSGSPQKECRGGGNVASEILRHSSGAIYFGQKKSRSVPRREIRFSFFKKCNLIYYNIQ